jgi:hypothetical protein
MRGCLGCPENIVILLLYFAEAGEQGDAEEEEPESQAEPERSRACSY